MQCIYTHFNPYTRMSTAVQRKGCLLIRILCTSEHLTTKSLCSSIAKVVVDALSRKNDVEVQAEVISHSSYAQPDSLFSKDILLHSYRQLCVLLHYCNARLKWLKHL